MKNLPTKKTIPEIPGRHRRWQEEQGQQRSGGRPRRKRGRRRGGAAQKQEGQERATQRAGKVMFLEDFVHNCAHSLL